MVFLLLTTRLEHLGQSPISFGRYPLGSVASHATIRAAPAWGKALLERVFSFRWSRLM